MSGDVGLKVISGSTRKRVLRRGSERFRGVEWGTHLDVDSVQRLVPGTLWYADVDLQVNSHGIGTYSGEHTTSMSTRPLKAASAASAIFGDAVAMSSLFARAAPLFSRIRRAKVVAASGFASWAKTDAPLEAR
jgi:hypothetical protein